MKHDLVKSVNTGFHFDQYEFSNLLTNRFLVTSNRDNYNIEFNFSTSQTLDEVRLTLCELLQLDVEAVMSIPTYGNFILNDGTNTVGIISFIIQNEVTNCFNNETKDIEFHIYGQKDLCILITKVLTDSYVKKHPKLMWNYMHGHGLKVKTFILEKPPEIKDSFYPFIEGGVWNYLKDYMESKIPILLLIGPPGTGKTSLIRNLIYNYNLKASFTYDEAVLESDYFFMNYAMDADSDAIIIEDADLLLSDRENASNRSMTKLLNVSDGIIQIPSKKIIFTTNLSDTTKIDSALIRPGRCYGVIDFRELTYSEAKKAASDVGIELTVDKDYSLAELFGKKTNNKIGYKHKKVGFF